MSLEVTLEIDLEAEPLHGYLHVAGEPASREFVGWIELVHALGLVLGKSGGDPRREAAGPEPR